jgi:hypothetical protein
MVTSCRYDQPVSQPSVAVVSRSEAHPGTGMNNLLVYLLCGSPRPGFLIGYRQRQNALLEQRLLAMEQKLLALEQGSQSDKPSPQSSRSIEVHTSTSPPAHRDQQPETSREPTGTSDQDDEVDGMGAVALIPSNEDEYFGKRSPRSLKPHVKLTVSPSTTKRPLIQRGPLAIHRPWRWSAGTRRNERVTTNHGRPTGVCW